MRNSRAHLITAFLLLSFAGLIWRAYDLQVRNRERFESLAGSQHRGIYELQPRRGAIYDSFMEVLAMDVKSGSIFADPSVMNDPGSAAEKLSPVLGIGEEELLRRFSLPRAFVWLRRKVPDEVVAEVKAMGLRGIHIVRESRRTYPNEHMAGHLLGFAGVDNQGLAGLELLYDDRLRGESGSRHLIRDARRRTVWYDDESSVQARDGADLVLTIDSVIQFLAERELAAMVERFNPDSATILVTEPYTGRILAIANHPSFDPNNYERFPPSIWKNPAVSCVHEPGSVFKAVIASAALEEGVFSRDDMIHCEWGSYQVGGRALSDFYSLGELCFADVFARSSNIGTVKIAQELGTERVYRYIRDFGFGERSGVDLPGEVRGLLRAPEAWSRSDISTIPIGQGIAVTPIQLAAAFGAIANGGLLMEPYVVDRIITRDGRIKLDTAPRVRRRVISSETSRQVREILHKAVVSGTGHRANSEIYQVCGKTGTAQMVRPEGGYYEDRYRASFVGFVPKEHPVLTIVVTAENPRPEYFGGMVAAPVFRSLAEECMQYISSTKRGRYASLDIP